MPRQQEPNSGDEVQDLRAEVAQLRALISNACQPQESHVAADSQRAAETANSDQLVAPKDREEKVQSSTDRNNNDLADPRERSPRGYYRQHTLLQFFAEVSCR